MKEEYQMPVFLAFLAGAIFASAASKSTNKNMKKAKENFDEVLDDDRELQRKVEEMLRRKEEEGEIIIKRKF
jgi:flagellar motor switch protein FliG